MTTFRRATIIAVGSEMLTPTRLDTNSLYITELLNGIGIDVVAKAIVGDDRAELEAHFAQALARVDLVIFTGGLGPTEDDLTREVVADHLGHHRFLVVGLSGGGPYALACEHEMADRVMAVGILGGLVPTTGEEAAAATGIVALARTCNRPLTVFRVPLGLGLRGLGLTRRRAN